MVKKRNHVSLISLRLTPEDAKTLAELAAIRKKPVAAVARELVETQLRNALVDREIDSLFNSEV